MRMVRPPRSVPATPTPPRGSPPRSSEGSRERSVRTTRARQALPSSGRRLASMRPRGELAIALHTHLPYVEGFGTWPFGEEWLWEAIATVYLPLLEVLRDKPVTIGITPVLCDQLETLTGDAGERFLSFLRDIRAPVHDEDARGLEQSGE